MVGNGKHILSSFSFVCPLQFRKFKFDYYAYQEISKLKFTLKYIKSKKNRDYKLIGVAL